MVQSSRTHQRFKSRDSNSGSPVNRPSPSTAQAKENQKFEIFLRCLENSKNLWEYYSDVGDYEYLLNFADLYCCCVETTGWAVEGGGRLTGEPEYF